MPLFLFLIFHWYLAGLSQSFFLHRYASHRMFELRPFWEKFFYTMTFLTQGASYLNPRTYALMHRMHHAYSDTEKDPHSPCFFKNPASMMMNTLFTYLDIFSGKKKVEERFAGGYPVWPSFDGWADRNEIRLFWILVYTLYYLKFAAAWWMYLFLPVHYFMGPIHGAIVNWCGHRYGYRNFDLKDESRNTLAVDLLTVGELMQNNHHRYGQRLNFAVKSYEFDPTYLLIRVLAKLGVVQFSVLKSSSEKQ